MAARNPGMQVMQIRKIEQYIQTNAREIDQQLYRFHVNNGDASAVLDALHPYQNADGGFGNGLEPDFRLPQSTALASWTAFQIIDQLLIDPKHEMVRCGLAYFINTYDPIRQGWPIVTPQVDQHPHAPWWHYETAINHFGWGNPSADIFGFLLKFYQTGLPEPMRVALTNQAVQRIQQVPAESFHEVQNFKGLYHAAPDDIKIILKQPLDTLIKKAVSIDPNDWRDYAATPLKFISAPDDPFISLFAPKTIRENLEFILDDLGDGTHWAPNWDWGNHYPDDWVVARQEWCGVLTVQNMITLRNFGAMMA